MSSKKGGGLRNCKSSPKMNRSSEHGANQSGMDPKMPKAGNAASSKMKNGK